MTHATFFKHFELLADQPDAVAKMRELVLDLAVRGKLVSSGSKAEKDSAWTEFLADATTANAGLSPAFDVPGHWCWARLDDAAAPCGQKKPDARFSYVDVGAIDNERGVIKESVEVLAPEDAPSRARKLVVQNAVIYSTVRPYLKNIAIIDRKFSPSAIVSTAFAVLNPKAILDSRYLYHWLRSRSFQADVESKMKGVAYPAISDSEFWQCLIPVPPPAEQRRIVAKVDELMALCDELEQRQQARQLARAQLAQSAYHHLTTAQDPAAFRKRLDFILHNSSFILEPSSLRPAILQLAVQGRLVQQNPKDEPAETLATKIRAEKERLTKELRLKDVAAEFPIRDEDKAIDLPRGWAWIKLANLCIKLGAGSTPLGGKQIYEKSGVKFLRSQNVHDDGLRLDDVAFIPPTIHKDMSGTWVQPGDILLNITGASIGRSAIVPDDFDEANVSQHVAIVRLADKSLRKFLHLVIISPDFQQRIMDVQVGVSREGLSMTRLKEFVVAVPPLAEQKRIVARVEELLRWCDTLAAQLHQTRTLGAHLLASTLERMREEG